MIGFSVKKNKRTIIPQKVITDLYKYYPEEAGDIIDRIQSGVLEFQTPETILHYASTIASRSKKQQTSVALIESSEIEDFVGSAYMTLDKLSATAKCFSEQIELEASYEAVINEFKNTAEYILETENIDIVSLVIDLQNQFGSDSEYSEIDFGLARNILLNLCSKPFCKGLKELVSDVLNTSENLAVILN